MTDIIEGLKIKKEALDIESKTIEAIITYLTKIGAVSTNGNGHKEAEVNSVEFTPRGFIRVKGNGGFFYLRRKRKWSRKPVKATAKRPVGRPRIHPKEK